MASSAEQGLISSVLRDEDFATAIADHVVPVMFHTYPDEWQWIVDYHSRYRKSPTVAAFRDAFPEFKTKAVNDTPHYVQLLKKSHAQYELTQMVREVADRISHGDVDDALSMVQQAIVDVSTTLGAVHDGDIFSANDDIRLEIMQRRERFQEHGSAGIPTGFQTLDERTGGPQPGELWVVGARLGEGKSYFMQRMAAEAMMSGRVVQFDALEQTRAQVSMRVYSMLSSMVPGNKAVFSASDLMQGKNYDPVAFNQFLRKARRLKGKLHVADAARGRVSANTVMSQIERNHPDIVYVDYLTLMAKKTPDWQGVADLSSDMLAIANRYALPVVVASQLNRTTGVVGAKEMPGAESISQADAIGQDATAVITMKKISASVLAMKMVKYRNGEGGFMWYCHFDPTLGVFREVTYNRAMELKDRDDDRRDLLATKR